MARHSDEISPIAKGILTQKARQFRRAQGRMSRGQNHKQGTKWKGPMTIDAYRGGQRPVLLIDAGYRKDGKFHPGHNCNIRTCDGCKNKMGPAMTKEEFLALNSAA